MTMWPWLSSWCVSLGKLLAFLCEGLRLNELLPTQSIVLSLLSPCLGNNVGETLWVWLPTFLRDTVSQQTPRFSGSSLFIPPLPQSSLSLRYRSGDVNTAIGIWLIICCNENFPWCRMRISLFYGYKSKYLECSYGIFSLLKCWLLVLLQDPWLHQLWVLG